MEDFLVLKQMRKSKASKNNNINNNESYIKSHFDEF